MVSGLEEGGEGSVTTVATECGVTLAVPGGTIKTGAETRADFVTGTSFVQPGVLKVALAPMAPRVTEKGGAEAHPARSAIPREKTVPRKKPGTTSFTAINYSRPP